MLKISSLHIRYFSLIIGLVIAILLYLINPFSVSAQAATVLAVAGLMITWWITEAVPLPVVALIPIISFPLFKITSLGETTAPYANPVIFLFLGGFMLGLAIEKWNLHRRIALSIINITGTSGNRIVLGFILATGLLSMWLSNTATTMMMFPIALSVIHVMKENHQGEGNVVNFSTSIMLSIAYAANMGGIGTIIGTPPNVAYVGYVFKKYNYEIDFINWMLVCTPLALLLLMVLYWVLVKLLFPNRITSNGTTRLLVKNEMAALGPLSVAEKRVLTIFILTAFLWVSRGVINDIQDLFRLDDTIIAVICTVSLFICPSGSKEKNKEALLEWADTSRMAWGILLLFGGGISLAATMEKAGLMEQIGHWLAQFSSNAFVLVLVITTVSIFISEVMSNVAQVIVFAPVISSLADALGMNPLLLGVPMALAASCAGMLPMGTPPNAIVFASGHIKFRQMVKAGFVMNLVSILLIILFSWFILPGVMKI